MAVSCAEPLKLPNGAVLDPNKQTTLEKPVSLSGIGLFTGQKAVLTLHPATPGTGIQLVRSDISGASPFSASISHVVSTPRCTILGNGSYTVQTVEHVLAALSGLSVDNVLLEINGPEIPIMDGSSDPFVTAILEAGIVEQSDMKHRHVLKKPVSWSKGEVHIIAIPADHFRISYTLQFPESTILHSQYYSAPVNPDHFAKEIAPCRTFCLYEEIAPFLEKIKGGGLDNAVIIKNDVVVNPEGIRFNDEMVRHKILDLIGDLSLIPPFAAHIVAIRSGHASNVAFANALYQHIQLEEKLDGRQ